MISQTSIRLPRREPRRKRRLEILVIAVFLTLPLLYVWVKSSGWLRPSYESTLGTILETRIVMDHAVDHYSGGSISYRMEAHVRYSIPPNGASAASVKSEERWLVVNEITTSIALLNIVQRQQPKTCLVYWISGHPETAKCKVE